MTDVETMIKRAEISMDIKTHKGGPSQLEICSRLFFLRNTGALFFLLSCNNDAEDLEKVPSFYKLL